MLSTPPPVDVNSQLPTIPNPSYPIMALQQMARYGRPPYGGINAPGQQGTVPMAGMATGMPALSQNPLSQQNVLQALSAMQGR